MVRGIYPLNLSKLIAITAMNKEKATERFEQTELGPRHTKPGLQAEKNAELTINTKRI